MLRNKTSLVAVVVVLILVSVAVHDTRSYRDTRLSTAPKINMLVVQRITDGEISYEERGGAIMITVTDRYMDNHNRFWILSV